jgi:hypothetical protein
MNDFTIRHTDTGGWPVSSGGIGVARPPVLYVDTATVSVSNLVLNSSLSNPMSVINSRFTMNGCQLWGGSSGVNALAATSSISNSNFYFGGLRVVNSELALSGTSFYGIDFRSASWPQAATTTLLYHSGSTTTASNVNFYFPSKLAIHIDSGTLSCTSCTFSNGTYTRSGIVSINTPRYGIYVYALGGTVTLRNSILNRITETPYKDYVIMASGSSTNVILNTTSIQPPVGGYTVFTTDINAFTMLDSSARGGLYFGSIWSQVLFIARSNLTDYSSSGSFDGLFGVNPSVLIVNATSSASISGCQFTSNTNLNAIELRGPGQLVVSDSSFVSNSRAIYAGSGTRLVVGGSIFGLNGPCDGAAITCMGCILGVSSSQFLYNQAYLRGCIRVSSSPQIVDIASSVFTGNRADLAYGASLLTHSGAAILIDSCTVSIIGCSFTSNSVLYAGGAVAIAGSASTSYATVLDCRFESNTASNAGALFAGELAQISVEGSDFVGNYAVFQGGAVFFKTWNHDVPTSADFLDATIDRCVFQSNYVGAALKKRDSSGYEDATGGGAVSINGDWRNVRLINSRFFENRVIGRSSGRRSEGGAIQLLAFEEFQEILLVEVRNCTFVANEVFGTVALGGALSSWGQLKLSISASTFERNRASSAERSFGGGAFVGGLASSFTSTLPVMVQTTSFTRNEARIGGGLVVHDTLISLDSVNFGNNSAQYVAGGLVAMLGKLQSSMAIPLIAMRIAGSEFSLNSVVDSEGGSVRNVTCFDRGVGGQENADFRCDSCTFASPSSSAPNWSPHFGAIMGEPFMLASSATKDPFLYVLPNSGYPATGSIVIPSFVGVSDKLDAIVVNFAESMLLQVSPGRCDQLLDAATIAQFYGQMSCTWDAAYTQLEIRAEVLGFPSTISFLQNNLVTKSQLLPVTSMPLSVLPPTRPVTPVSRIAALPVVVPPCSDIVLDGTTSFFPGSFQYNLRWNLQNAPIGFDSVETLATDEQSLRLAIPRSVIPVSSSAVVLSFSLTAGLPFLSVPSVATINITLLPTSGPSVFIEGPSERFHPAALELQLNARIEVPACLAVQNVSISSSWTQISGPSLSLSTVDGPSLFFPARTLLPSQFYKFRFSAFVASNPLLQGSAEVEVTALYGPMSVYPSGSGGIMWNDLPAKLEITVVDLENSPGPALVLWDIVGCPSAAPSLALYEAIRTIYRVERPICFYPGWNNCTNGAPSLIFGTKLNNTLDVTTLPTGNYSIHVSVAKDGRLAETQIWIQLEQNPVDSTSRPLNIVIKPHFNTKPNPSERIAFSASVTGYRFDPTTMVLQWEILQNSSLLHPDNLLTPIDTLHLAFKPFVFPPSPCVLQLSIFDKNSSRLLGRNQFLVDVNGAPSGGQFDVEPLSLQLFDLITVRALSWADNDAPLRYIFSILVDLLDGSPPFEFPLADVLDLASLNVPIPAVGSPNNSNLVTLRLRVRDAFGAESVVERYVTVTPPNSSVPIDTSSLLERLSNYFAAGDLRSGVGVIISVVQQARISNGTVSLSTSSTILSALDTFVSKVRLTAVNTRFVVKIVQTLLVNDTRLATRSVAADLLVECVKAVKEAFQTESAWLTFSNQHDAGLQELNTISGAIVGVVQSARLNRRDLISAVTDLLYVISRTSVPGETGFASSSGDVSLSSFVLPTFAIDAPAIVLGAIAANFTVSVDGISSIGSALGDRVTVETVVWTNSSFPSVLLNETGHNYDTNVTTATTMGGTVASITIRGSNSSVLSANITVLLPLNPPRSDVGNASFSSCAQFIPSSNMWDSSGCVSGPIVNGMIQCSCSPKLSEITVGSPAAPATSGQGIHLGTLFGVQYMQDRERPTEPGTDNSPSSAATTGDIPNSVLGPAIGGAIAGAVVIAAAVALSYYLYKRAQEAKSKKQLASALKKANSL